MIVEPDFPDHWKTQMLIQLSSDQSSPMWVLRLWAHCQLRKTHEFTNFPPEAIKAVCRFVGQASQLESLLRTAGFIRRCDDKLIVHQWNEYNAQLLANWGNGKLGGRPKIEPKTEPNDNPTITHGLAMGNPTVTQREPIEKIEEIKKKEKKKVIPHPNEIIEKDIPRLRQFERLWESSFKETFKDPYLFSHGRDQKGINSLLKLEGYEVNDFLQIAKKAWAFNDEKKAWRCVHCSKTIHGFAANFNQIRDELGLLKAVDSSKDYGKNPTGIFANGVNS